MKTESVLSCDFKRKYTYVHMHKISGDRYTETLNSNYLWGETEIWDRREINHYIFYVLEYFRHELAL